MRWGDSVIGAPLRKHRLDGQLYVRDAKVNAHIAELALLSRDELIARAAITNRSDPTFVPSECLLHFIRASRRDNNDVWFERLYRILTQRVMRSLPTAKSADGKTESLTRGAIRDQALSRFVELLSVDRVDYSEKLDYFEVRFDGALVSLRRDAQEKAWRDENRSRPLEFDEESGELSPEVEAAAGVYDPSDLSDLDDPIYRSRLEAAIEALPTEQKRIIHMRMQGFLIDPKDPGALSIVKVLGLSEKTIRTYLKRALATLRTTLSAGDDQ